MHTILLSIGPLLVLIGLGFYLGRSNFISKEFLSGLSRLTFTFFIPALLFLSIYQSDDLSNLTSDLLLAFYLPVVGLFGFSFLLFRKLFRAKFPKTELLSLASTFSNNVLIGIPVLISFFGNDVLLPGFFIVSIHSLLLFSLTSLSAALIGSDANSNDSSWYRSVATSLWLTTRSPIVLSLIVGLGLKLIDFSVPTLIIKPLELLQGAALPCALIVLGSSLAKYRVAGDWWTTAVVSAFKLVLLPALVGLSAHFLFGLSDKLIAITVVMSASPVGINVFMFAAQDKAASPYLATTILVSTLLSLITIPCWLFILNLV